MTLAQLLRELDGLSHSQRVQRMVGLQVPEKLFSELLAGAAYQRGLALYSCYGSRDPARVARFFTDRSASLRGLARKLAVQVCSDEQLAALLDELPARPRLRLLMRLLRAGRRRAVDAWHEAAPRNPEWLPYCSEAIVRQHLEGFVDAAGGDDWARLARVHPGLTVELLRDRARRVDERDNRLRYACARAFLGLVQADPDAALSLLEELVRHLPLRLFDLRELALRRPAATARLLLGRGERPSVDFSTRVAQLPVQVLAGLVEAGVLGQPETWLRHLPAEARSELYRRFGTGWRTQEGLLMTGVVKSLASEDRRQEARRHLQLPELATRPQARLGYAAFLEFEEARREVDPWLRNPDPDLRRAAVRALLAAARYRADDYARALEVVRYRKNEQDPIRLAMFETLAELPPGRWQAGHLESLGEAFREALNAADLSFATATAIAHMVARLLPFQPAWSADWLARLVKDRGQLPPLPTLTRQQVAHVLPSLLPVLRSWATREREGYLLAALEACGKALRDHAALLEMLENLAKSSRSWWVTSRALSLLREHGLERLDRLIPELLKKDESWAILEPVHGFLHYRRQDLLTPFLGHRVLKGRWVTGRTAFLLPFWSGFHRWTPSQHELFAKSLHQLAVDAMRDTPTVGSALVQLAALPVPPATLRGLAQLDYRLPAVRDCALRALARRDEADGLPTLLEALADERARIAIYALRRALREAHPRDALQVLRDVPTDKVTVTKEVVRLLGELPGEAAYKELARWAERPLHRDVHVALLRALWDHVEKDSTWELFEKAADSEDPAVAAGVIAIPADRMDSRARLRLARLQAQLLKHPEARLRLKTQQRLLELPFNDPERVLLEPLLEGLQGNSDERAAAAGALFAVYGVTQLSCLGDSTRRLLPQRRALETLCSQLCAQVDAQGRRVLPLAKTVLTVLAEDPVTVVWQVRLAVRALPWKELYAWLRQVSWHGEALSAAVTALAQAGRRPDARGLDALERQLRKSRQPALRRLGLAALVAAAEPPRGWTDERREALAAYCGDPALQVRSAAEFIFPS